MSLLTTPTVAELATYGLRELARLQRSSACMVDAEAQFRLRLVPAFADRLADRIEHVEALEAATSWANRDGAAAAHKTVKRSQWLWRLGAKRGLIEARDPWHGIELPRKPPRKHPASRSERETLQAYLEPIVFRGVRSRFSVPSCAAILTLSETPALRVQEGAGLPRADVDLPARLIRSTRHKTRAKTAVKLIAISDYQAALFVRLDALWGEQREYVFPGMGGGPVHELWTTCTRLCRHLGLPHISPHDLRRGCAQEALDGGARLEQIQQLLGHESVKTTEAYLGWSETQARAAVRLITLRPIGAVLGGRSNDA